MINSLCLIPETKCGRKCPNCYEEKKKYRPSLTQPMYIKLVSQHMTNLPSLTELLIDYNGNESPIFLEALLALTTVTKTITTNIEGLWQLRRLSGVNFHLSLHTIRDVRKAKELKENFPFIKSFSVMADEIDDLALQDLGDVPFYIIVNKFGYHWKNEPAAVNYMNIITKSRHLKNIHLDNCLLTRINGQECPGATQINIYRDGSVRHCPYIPEETKKADYSKGCYLIGSKR